MGLRHSIQDTSHQSMPAELEIAAQDMTNRRCARSMLHCIRSPGRHESLASLDELAIMFAERLFGNGRWRLPHRTNVGLHRFARVVLGGQDAGDAAANVATCCDVTVTEAKISHEFVEDTAGMRYVKVRILGGA